MNPFFYWSGVTVWLLLSSALLLVVGWLVFGYLQGLTCALDMALFAQWAAKREGNPDRVGLWFALKEVPEFGWRYFMRGLPDSASTRGGRHVWNRPFHWRDTSEEKP